MGNRDGLIGAFVALAAALIPAEASAAEDPRKAWPPDGDLTNRVALSRLVALPTAPGNGCADYLVLTAPEDTPPPFAELNVGLTTRTEGAAEGKTRLKKHAADAAVLARLDRFRSGAMKAECRTVGAVYPWPEPTNPLRWKLPAYMPVMAHAAVAIQHAFELEAQGKTDEARAWLETIVVVGWHFQQDVTLIANMVGIAIGAAAADALGDLWDGRNDSAMEGRWRAYAGVTRWRRYEGYKDLITPLFERKYATTEEGIRWTAEIADAPGMLRGARAEAMLMVAVAHLRRPGAPPADAQQRARLAAWIKQSDPALADAAKSFVRLLDLDDVARKKIASEMARDESDAK